MLVKYCAGVGAGTRICGMRTGPFSPLFGVERLLKLTQAACVIFMYQRTIWRTAEGGRRHSRAVLSSLLGGSLDRSGLMLGWAVSG